MGSNYLTQTAIRFWTKAWDLTISTIPPHPFNTVLLLMQKFSAVYVITARKMLQTPISHHRRKHQMWFHGVKIQGNRLESITPFQFVWNAINSKSEPRARVGDVTVIVTKSFPSGYIVAFALCNAGKANLVCFWVHWVHYSTFILLFSLQIVNKDFKSEKLLY